MNIFYLDSDPKLAAQYHNDKHTVKMILEYSQLLSTAHRLIDGKPVAAKTKTGRNIKRWQLNDLRDGILYTATHANHPSAIWVRQSVYNYRWLHNLLLELLEEYTYRYGKNHKCETIAHYLTMAPFGMEIGSFTEPTPAMPDECKVAGNSVQSYRNYYNMRKQHIASWKGKVNSRSAPSWFIPEVSDVS
jgi:hypothetical protein